MLVLSLPVNLKELCSSHNPQKLYAGKARCFTSVNPSASVQAECLKEDNTKQENRDIEDILIVKETLLMNVNDKVGRFEV